MAEIQTISNALQKIEDADYHRLHYCSKHALDVIHDQSPMHLDYQRKNPKPPTDAMKFGTALHTFILEPEQFAQRHVIIGQCEAVKKDKTRCMNVGKKQSAGGQWLCGVHEADDSSEIQSAITEDQHLKIRAMHESILRCDAAREILNAPGQNELVGIFDRMIQGDGWSHEVKCKMKIDGIRESWEAVFDIKTCESAAPGEFTKSIGNFGYHRQGAFYIDALERLGVKVKHFIIIAVEKEPPFGTAVYRLTSDSIELGRDQNERLMVTYAACERTGHWHGYEATFNDISVPDYIIRKERRVI